MRYRETSDLVEAIKMIRRWAEVDIPEHVWTEPGEDYLLPHDTQVFLSTLKED